MTCLGQPSSRHRPSLKCWNPPISDLRAHARPASAARLPACNRRDMHCRMPVCQKRRPMARRTTFAGDIARPQHDERGDPAAPHAGCVGRADLSHLRAIAAGSSALYGDSSRNTVCMRRCVATLARAALAASNCFCGAFEGHDWPDAPLTQPAPESPWVPRFIQHAIHAPFSLPWTLDQLRVVRYMWQAPGGPTKSGDHPERGGRETAPNVERPATNAVAGSRAGEVLADAAHWQDC